jgi:hypothetical protein
MNQVNVDIVKYYEIRLTLSSAEYEELLHILTIAGSNGVLKNLSKLKRQLEEVSLPPVKR